MVSQFLFSICLRELLSLSFRNNPRDGSDVEVIQTLDPEVAGLRAHPLVDAVDVVSAHISAVCWTGNNRSPEVGRGVEAVHVVRRGHVAGALPGLVPVADVPELAAPADEELGVGVVDPGGAAPHQRVGHGVAAQLVEVDHPDAVVALRSQVQLAAARTGACTEDSRGHNTRHHVRYVSILLLM